ncbi:11310_t:CDS:1, partial [Gigaspora rosea]
FRVDLEHLPDNFEYFSEIKLRTETTETLQSLGRKINQAPYAIAGR